ncbi:MAG TPA: hypothetical protein VHE83_08750 [Mycobacteriales bacterium]|nr:hypothetical protein [Mycobacteriales bacterium]
MPRRTRLVLACASIACAGTAALPVLPVLAAPAPQIHDSCPLTGGPRHQTTDPVRAGVSGQRVVRRISLDHGTFVAAPAGPGSCPPLRPDEAYAVLRIMEPVDTSNPAGTVRSEVFGYGYVTVKVPRDAQHRALEHFAKRPAFFLATAFEGAYSCPAQHGPAPKTTKAQRGFGYHIEVLDGAGRDAIGYTEAGASPCSGALHPPSYDLGWQVFSAAWTIGDHGYAYTEIPRCGRITTTSGRSGGGQPSELWVYVQQLVGTHHPGCIGPRRQRVHYSQKGGVPTAHPPVGRMGTPGLGGEAPDPHNPGAWKPQP